MTRYLFAAFLTIVAAPHAVGDTLILNFNGSGIGVIDDSLGQPTGFTHRLPGSGGAIPASDPNLTVDGVNGHLLIQSTRSDFNSTGFGRNLDAMEAPAVRVNGLAASDFIVRATFVNIHVDDLSDQLGVFVGTSVDNVLRAGVHEQTTPDYQSFLVYSQNGTDGPPQGGQPSSIISGQDAEFEIGRISGQWHFRWTNLSDPSKSGVLSNLAVPLGNAASLYFGVFNHDARNLTPQVATLDRFVLITTPSVPEPSSLLLGTGFFAIAALRRVKGC